ncbi:MAG: hypothetical protein AB1414_03955 [bacterium]
MNNRKTITKIFNPVMGFLIEILAIFIIIVLCLIIAGLVWYIK